MGLWDAMYRVVMRRNGVYVTFVVAGAFAGERLVDYGVSKVWEMNNIGKRVSTHFSLAKDAGGPFTGNLFIVAKRYQDISVLGQRPVEE